MRQEEAALGPEWEGEPSKTERGQLKYRMRAGRYSIVQNDDGAWGVIAENGDDVATGLDMDSARQRAEELARGGR
jgi:hypothetical protein